VKNKTRIFIKYFLLINVVNRMKKRDNETPLYTPSHSSYKTPQKGEKKRTNGRLPSNA
jgi:hypothetical protein